MAIRNYRNDPRTTEEKQADEDARLRFERGEFLAVDASIEKQALEYVQRRYEVRRDMVALCANVTRLDQTRYTTKPAGPEAHKSFDSATRRR